jgi:isopentenyldiphosphate isomerase
MSTIPNTLSAQELIEIVDENNNVLEPKLRYEMRRDRLIHRATYALIRDSNNYFYVQKRSMLKDYCPGFFDPTPGGVVAAGESYEVTNRREIEEEMGIKGVENKHLFTFYYEDHRIKCFGDAWEVVYDGPLKLQKEEVDEVEMMSMKEILDRADAGENFTPDSIHACREYVKQKGFLETIGPKKKPTLILE